MKKLNVFWFIIVICLISQYAYSQNIGDLKGIYYQAVAIDENGKEIVGMDVEGKPLYEKAVGVKFTITKGLNGAIQWEETHTTTTDKYGLFTLIIGQGTTNGNLVYTRLLDIPWIDADQFLKVEIATKNDGNYKVVSNQQFMTVPYSFYTDDIADDAITTAKILNETILAEDIATGAVTTSEILDETILAEDIDTGAVTTSEILDETILAEDIATGAVTTSEILDETILAEDIATGAVTTSEILDETILAEDIATGAVTTSEILDETILAEDIATGAVTTSEILDETILAEDIATGAVTTSEILDETILAEDIDTGAVTTSEILDETILAEDIATGAVTTSEILNGTILNEDIANGTIDLTTKVTGILPVPNGGTGNSTLTDGGLLFGKGTGTIQSLPQAINGQIPVGVTSADPRLKLLTGGTGINITYTTDSVIVSSGIQGVNSTSAGNVNVNIIANGTTFISPAIPLPGVVLGNIVVGSCDVDTKGCILYAYVFSLNNIKVAISNTTGFAQDLGTVALKVFVVQ